MPHYKSSKSQIDKLGERLKAGTYTPDDLRMLDEYRRSFDAAHEQVIRAIRQIGEMPTSRRAKSNASIVAKLLRERTRLSKMQDISGCRVVVSGIMEQEQTVESLKAAFPSVTIIDRRNTPSHGYRAVHIIVESSERHVEVQVRTSLQHMWAELSERSSDVLGPQIKYGGGPDFWRRILMRCTEGVAAYEETEATYGTVANMYTEIQKACENLAADLVLDECPEQDPQTNLNDLRRRMLMVEREIDELQRRLTELRSVAVEVFNTAISMVDGWRNQKE